MHRAAQTAKRRNLSEEEIAKRTAARRRNAEDRLMKTLTNFSSLPDDVLVDIKIVTRVIDRSPSSVWRDVRHKRLAAPVRAGAQSSKWRVGDIRKVLRGNVDV